VCARAALKLNKTRPSPLPGKRFYKIFFEKGTPRVASPKTWTKSIRCLTEKSRRRVYDFSGVLGPGGRKAR
jgi:hypothetical protein